MTTTKPNTPSKQTHHVTAIKAINPLNGFGLGKIKIDYTFKGNGNERADSTWPLSCEVNLDCLSPHIMTMLVTEALKRKLSYAPGVNIKGQPNHERASAMALALQALYDGQWTKKKAGIKVKKTCPIETHAVKLARQAIKEALDQDASWVAIREAKATREEYYAEVTRLLNLSFDDEDSKAYWIDEAKMDLERQAKRKANAPKIVIGKGT